MFFFPYFAKFLVSIPKPKKLTFSFLAPVVLLSGAELDHFFSWDVNPNFFILIVLSLNFLLVLFFFFLFGKVVNLKLSF